MRSKAKQTDITKSTNSHKQICSKNTSIINIWWAQDSIKLLRIYQHIIHYINPLQQILSNRHLD